MRARASAEIRRVAIDRAFAEAEALLRQRMDDRTQSALVERTIAGLDALSSTEKP
jgi:F0F1-type ATP synthase membrane subunit b/b'